MAHYREYDEDCGEHEVVRAHGGSDEEFWELEETVFAGLRYAKLYADDFINCFLGYKENTRHPREAATLLFKEAEKRVLTGGDGSADLLREFCVGEGADAEHFYDWMNGLS